MSKFICCRDIWWYFLSVNFQLLDTMVLFKILKPSKSYKIPTCFGNNSCLKQNVAGQVDCLWVPPPLLCLMLSFGHLIFSTTPYIIFQQYNNCFHSVDILWMSYTSKMWKQHQRVDKGKWVQCINRSYTKISLDSYRFTIFQ